MDRRRRPVSMVVASVACFAVLAAVLVSAKGEGRRAVDIGVRVRGSDIIIGTPVRSIRAAEQALGVHIPRPQAWAANDGTIRSVSVNVRNREVGITYAPLSYLGLPSYGRVQVVIEFRGRLYATPTGYRRWAEQEVRALGSVSSLVDVKGWPALVLQGNFGGDCSDPGIGEEGCAPPQHNPTALQMQFDRASVSIYGPGAWDPPTIEAVASTLR
jgi:hypothetical protein